MDPGPGWVRALAVELSPRKSLSCESNGGAEGSRTPISALQVQNATSERPHVHIRFVIHWQGAKESNLLSEFWRLPGRHDSAPHVAARARAAAPRTGIEPVSSARQADCDASRITRQIRRNEVRRENRCDEHRGSPSECPRQESNLRHAGLGNQCLSARPRGRIEIGVTYGNRTRLHWVTASPRH